MANRSSGTFKSRRGGWVVSQGEFSCASMEGGMQAHGLMLSSQLDKSLIR